MKTEDLEDELRNLKNIHLTDNELAAYCDQDLDEMRRARMEAHLKQCFICAQQLTIWKEESAALKDRKITADDINFVKRLVEQRGLERKPASLKTAATVKKPSPSKRLAEYIRQLNADWQSYVIQLKPARGATKGGTEIWRGESKRRVVVAYAVLEKTADLTIHISSTDPEMEGSRLRVRAGSHTWAIILERDPQSVVSGQVTVPRRKRPKRLTDISIEQE